MLNSTCKTKHFWNFMHETSNMNFFLFNLLHYNFSFMSLCISFYIFQLILFNVDIFTCGCVTVVEPQLSCHTLFTALLSALLCTTTLGAGGSATTKPLLSIKLKKKPIKNFAMGYSPQPIPPFTRQTEREARALRGNLPRWVGTTYHSHAITH